MIQKYFRLIWMFLMLCLCSCALQQASGVARDVYPEKRILSTSGGLAEEDVFQALAKIDFKTVDASYHVRAALVLRRPGYVRLEVLPLIGNPDLLLTATPDTMTVFVPSKKELYRGRPTRSNLEKFLPWSMDIEDMVLVLTGTYPFCTTERLAEDVSSEGRLGRMTCKKSSGESQIIWVQEGSQKLMRLLCTDETGSEKYTVQYFYGGQSALPEKLVIRLANGSTALTVTYSDVRVEKTKDLSVFNLTAPSDVEQNILE